MVSMRWGARVMHSRLGARCAWLALCSAWLSMASPAAAQGQDELARRHFESGEAYFAEAEYEEALKAFWKAYELSNRPEILVSIGLVEERLGNLEGAVSALDQYLARSGAGPDAQTVRQRRDELLRRSQRRAPKRPEPGPLPASRDAAQAAPTASAPDLTAAYLTLSVGALSTVGALLTGLGAQLEYDELELTCARRACDDSDTRTGETLALTSTVLTAVAVVGVGVGAALWADALSQPEPAGPGPSVDVAVLPGSGYARARWRF
jgi:tetratricopeptide (TPR) repeat protein